MGSPILPHFTTDDVAIKKSDVVDYDSGIPRAASPAPHSEIQQCVEAALATQELHFQNELASMDRQMQALMLKEQQFEVVLASREQEWNSHLATLVQQITVQVGSVLASSLSFLKVLRDYAAYVLYIYRNFKCITSLVSLILREQLRENYNVNCV
jgi:hypothetical protein